MAVRDVEKVGDELRKRVKGILAEVGVTSCQDRVSSQGSQVLVL